MSFRVAPEPELETELVAEQVRLFLRSRYRFFSILLVLSAVSYVSNPEIKPELVQGQESLHQEASC
jgi:hypothetical protein